MKASEKHYNSLIEYDCIVKNSAEYWDVIVLRRALRDCIETIEMQNKAISNDLGRNPLGKKTLNWAKLSLERTNEYGFGGA